MSVREGCTNNGEAAISDEAILEAVVQIMEMNGGGKGSGWDLRFTLEHARDTESILRTMIDGSILTDNND